MARQRVRIDHPLYERLRQVDKKVARQFPEALFPGLWAAGLRLDQTLNASRYTNHTPLNCFTFADTGGDGVHFSFLVRDGMIRESSPVVMTVPCAANSLIVGEDLFDFLCLGSQRGYFALEQLAYEPEVTHEVYTNSDWQPTQRWHESVGFVPDEAVRRVLALLTSEFGLRPWASPARFELLQERYAATLELPPKA